MGKQKKVMDIHLDGFHLVCIRTSDIFNPFRVYKVTAGSRRQIAKYADFFSVVCFIKDLYLDGVDTMTTADAISWARERGSIY